MVAIKQIELDIHRKKEDAIEETSIMRDCRHPNIVKFIDSFVHMDVFWLVMEFMEGGALTDIIENNTLEEDQISSICLEASRFASCN